LNMLPLDFCQFILNFISLLLLFGIVNIKLVLKVI
jgi:hypothetical protein